jgi:hypothetical protein
VTTRVPCDEIAADAMGLFALPADAPERTRAEAHAAGCADCARALAEGRRLWAMLDAAMLPAPSPAALARASAAVLAEADKETSMRAFLSVFAAVVAAWAIPLALMRAPIVAGTPLSASLGIMLLAATASIATVVWSRGAALAFPALSAITALAAGRGSALAPVVGVHCAAIEAMTAAAAGAGAWYLARALARARHDRALEPRPRLVSLEVAAVGGGALAGHAALHLGCSASSELPHLLVFHTGPVVLAVGLALALAASADRARAARGSSRP